MDPRLLRRLASEARSLVVEPEDCVTLQWGDGAQGPETLDKVALTMEGPPGTPYHQGAFRILLTFGDDYPTRPPTGRFVTRIFHPNVSEAGDICVNVLKTDWQPDLTVRHIIRTIRCLLIHPNADSALNEEAAKMLQEDYHLFAAAAAKWTRVYAAPVAAREPTAPTSGVADGAANTPGSTALGSQLRAQSQSSQNILANGYVPPGSPPPTRKPKAAKKYAAPTRRRL